VVDVVALRKAGESAKVEAEAKSLKGRLGNHKFVDKAPPEVVKGRDTLEEAEKQVEILQARLKRLTWRINASTQSLHHDATNPGH